MNFCLFESFFLQPELICLTVRGLFKEPGATLLDNDLWFGFSRTLILTPYLKGLVSSFQLFMQKRPKVGNLCKGSCEGFGRELGRTWDGSRN